MAAPLTLRQQQILDYIRAYLELHGYAPSLRDIQQALDIGSTSVVDHHLRRLEALGHISRTPNTARAIRVC